MNTFAKSAKYCRNEKNNVKAKRFLLLGFYIITQNQYSKGPYP